MSILSGYYDLHLHSAPAPFARIGDSADIALWCASAGMAGIVVKSHFESTVSKVHHARKAVEGAFPDFQVHSSIALNRGVGGVNPGAVELALQQGAKCVWLPTLDAKNHGEAYGEAGTYGIAEMTLASRRPGRTYAYTVLDEAGCLTPEVEEVIALTLDYGVILGTGHLSVREMRAVLARCTELGHEKLVVTHPELRTAKLSLDEMITFTKAGAYLEFCAVYLLPVFLCLTLDQLVTYLGRLPLDRILLSSDGGQPFNPKPHETIEIAVRGLLSKGVSPQAIETICKANPARLLASA